jgi:hypothetical protein
MEQAKLVEVIEELISKSDDYFRKLDVRGVAYVQVEPPSSRTYQMAKGPIVRACSAFAPMPMSLEGETGGRLL